MEAAHLSREIVDGGAPPTFQAGAVLHAADLNALSNDVAALQSPPAKYRFLGYSATSESVAPGTDTSWVDLDLSPVTSASPGTVIEVGATITPAQMLNGGVTFTPPRAGYYDVAISFNHTPGGTFCTADYWAATNFAIGDGQNDSAGVTSYVQNDNSSNGCSVRPVQIRWIYQATTAGTAVTLRLQYERLDGTWFALVNGAPNFLSVQIEEL